MKLFMTILFGGMLLLPALALSESADDVRQQQEALPATNEGVLMEQLPPSPTGRPSKITKVNSEPSKIEALKGTWDIFYTEDQTKHQDKLVINKIETKDGTLVGTGELLISPGIPTGYSYISKMPLVCSDAPAANSKLNGRYLCAGTFSYWINVTPYITNTMGRTYLYYFDFSDNNITVGYLAKGAYDLKPSAYNEALNDLPLIAFSGYHNSPSLLEIYNLDSGELVLPRVGVSGQEYSVTLANDGNNLFWLKSYRPIPSSSSMPNPIEAVTQYNSQTGYLTVPQVQVGNTDYSAVLSSA